MYSPTGQDLAMLLKITLNFLIAPLLLLKYWDYRCVPPYSVYALGKLRIFCTVSKQKTEPYLQPLILLFLFTEISLVYTVE